MRTREKAYTIKCTHERRQERVIQDPSGCNSETVDHECPSLGFNMSPCPPPTPAFLDYMSSRQSRSEQVDYTDTKEEMETINFCVSIVCRRLIH